jgi:hypothetical protein
MTRISTDDAGASMVELGLIVALFTLVLTAFAVGIGVIAGHGDNDMACWTGHRDACTSGMAQHSD